MSREERKCVTCERHFIATGINDGCPYCAAGRTRNGPIIAILKHRVSLIEQTHKGRPIRWIEYGKMVGYLEAIDLLELQAAREVPFTGDPMVDSTGGCI